MVNSRRVDSSRFASINDRWETFIRKMHEEYPGVFPFEELSDRPVPTSQGEDFAAKLEARLRILLDGYDPLTQKWTEMMKSWAQMHVSDQGAAQQTYKQEQEKLEQVVSQYDSQIAKLREQLVDYKRTKSENELIKQELDKLERANHVNASPFDLRLASGPQSGAKVVHSRKKDKTQGLLERAEKAEEALRILTIKLEESMHSKAELKEINEEREKDLDAVNEQLNMVYQLLKEKSEELEIEKMKPRSSSRVSEQPQDPFDSRLASSGNQVISSLKAQLLATQQELGLIKAQERREGDLQRELEDKQEILNRIYGIAGALNTCFKNLAPGMGQREAERAAADKVRKETLELDFSDPLKALCETLLTERKKAIEMRETLGTTHRTIEELRYEIEKLSQNNSGKKGKKIQLQLQAEIANLKEVLERYKTEIEALQGREGELQGLRERFDQLTEEFKAKNLLLENMESQYQDRISHFERRILELTQIDKDQKQQLSQIQEQMEVAAQTMAGHQGKLEILLEERRASEGRVYDLQREIVARDQKIQEMNVAQLQTELDMEELLRIKGEAEALRRMNAAQTEAIEDLKEQNRELRGKFKNLSDQISELDVGVEARDLVSRYLSKIKILEKVAGESGLNIQKLETAVHSTAPLISKIGLIYDYLTASVIQIHDEAVDEIASLKERIDELELLVQTMNDDQTTENDVEKAQMERKIQELSDELNRVSSQLTRAEAEVKEMQLRSLMNRGFAERQAELRRVTENNRQHEVERLRGVIVELESQITDLLSVNQKARLDLNRGKPSFANAMNAVLGEVFAGVGQSQEAQKKLAEATEKAQETQQRLGELEKEFRKKELQLNLSTQENRRLNQLLVGITAQEQSVERLMQDVLRGLREQGAKADALSSKNLGLQDELAELRKQLQQAEGSAQEVARLKALIDKKERTEKSLHDQIETLQVELTRSAAQYQVLQHEKDSLESQVQRLTDQVEESESGSLALKEALEKINSEFEAVTEKFSSLERELERLAQENVTLREALETSEQENVVLEEGLVIMEDRLDDVLSKMKENQLQMHSLRQGLKQSDERIQELEAENEDLKARARHILPPVDNVNPHEETLRRANATIMALKVQLELLKEKAKNEEYVEAIYYYALDQNNILRKQLTGWQVPLDEYPDLETTDDLDAAAVTAVIEQNSGLEKLYYKYLLEQQKQQHQRDVEGHLQEVQKLGQKVEGLEHENKALKTQVSASQAEIRRVTDANAILQRDNDALKQENKSLKDRIGEQGDEIRYLRLERDLLLSTVQSVDVDTDEVAAQLDEFDRLKAGIAALQRENENLQAANLGLRFINEENNKEIERLKEEGAEQRGKIEAQDDEIIVLYEEIKRAYGLIENHLLKIGELEYELSQRISENTTNMDALQVLMTRLDEQEREYLEQIQRLNDDIQVKDRYAVFLENRIYKMRQGKEKLDQRIRVLREKIKNLTNPDALTTVPPPAPETGDPSFPQPSSDASNNNTTDPASGAVGGFGVYPGSDSENSANMHGPIPTGGLVSRTTPVNPTDGSGEPAAATHPPAGDAANTVPPAADTQPPVAPKSEGFAGVPPFNSDDRSTPTSFDDRAVSTAPPTTPPAAPSTKRPDAGGSADGGSDASSEEDSLTNSTLGSGHSDNSGFNVYSNPHASETDKERSVDGDEFSRSESPSGSEESIDPDNMSYTSLGGGDDKSSLDSIVEIAADLRSDTESVPGDNFDSGSEESIDPDNMSRTSSESVSPLVASGGSESDSKSDDNSIDDDNPETPAGKSKRKRKSKVRPTPIRTTDSSSDTSTPTVATTTPSGTSGSSDSETSDKNNPKDKGTSPGGSSSSGSGGGDSGREPGLAIHANRFFPKPPSDVSDKDVIKQVVKLGAIHDYCEEKDNGETHYASVDEMVKGSDFVGNLHLAPVPKDKYCKENKDIITGKLQNHDIEISRKKVGMMVEKNSTSKQNYLYGTQVANNTINLMHAKIEVKKAKGIQDPKKLLPSKITLKGPMAAQVAQYDILRARLGDDIYNHIKIEFTCQQVDCIDEQGEVSYKDPHDRVSMKSLKQSFDFKGVDNRLQTELRASPCVLGADKVVKTVLSELSKQHKPTAPRPGAR